MPLTDSSGSLTASASYGVYGDLRSSTGSLGSLGYTGALSDTSGLVYLQARSLDPTTGTFTARDSLTPGGPGITGFNPYAYAGQNPTTLTDPSGRDTDSEYGVLGMIRVAAAPVLAQFSVALNALLVRALLVLLIPIGLGCAAGIACPIELPWDGGRSRPGDRTNPRGGQLVDKIMSVAEDVGVYLTALEATEVLQTCLSEGIPFRLGRGPEEACTGKAAPIFVSAGMDRAGRPILEATLHDGMVLLRRTDWTILHFNGVDYSYWRTRLMGCQGTIYKTACDEFPFNKTAEGGPNGPADLRIIDWYHNSYQGADLGAFYVTQRVRTPSSAFAVFAIPDPKMRSFFIP